MDEQRDQDRGGKRGQDRWKGRELLTLRSRKERAKGTAVLSRQVRCGLAPGPGQAEWGVDEWQGMWQGMAGRA